MVSHKTVEDAARNPATNPEELDKMFWAAETGSDYPLSLKDDGIWRIAKVTGQAVAMAATDLGRALVYAEAMGDIVNIEMVADKERARFLMTVMVDGDLVTSRASGAPGLQNAGVIVVAAMSEMRVKLLEIERSPEPQDWMEGP